MYGNNRQNTKTSLYQLKYRYGRLVYVRHPVANTNDVTTGKILRTFEVTKIKRAVVMAPDKLKTAVYDLTYIASNKNFGYGGFFEKNSVIVIIDQRDFSKTIDSTSHLVIDTRRYEIASIDDYEGNHMVAAKMVEPSTPILDINGD